MRETFRTVALAGVTLVSACATSPRELTPEQSVAHRGLVEVLNTYRTGTSCSSGREAGVPHPLAEALHRFAPKLSEEGIAFFIMRESYDCAVRNPLDTSTFPRTETFFTG